jgi:2-methylisocitrate lyase-like PEP mutase family enzyme
MMLVENAGFDAAYLSGASLAYTRHGSPDIGLVTMTEVAETVSLIRERSEMPLIVDADTGYGNAINTQRTVKLFERCGASMIQLEDQSFPKRCGHLREKSVIPAKEMTGKLKAALDARRSSETLIIARTDAVASEGLESTLERAEHYLETGIDVLFVEALTSSGQMRLVNKRFSPRIPLMANMVEGGKTPLMSSQELEEIGYSLVIFPGGYVRATAKLATRYFESLKKNGTTEPFLEEMLNFNQLQSLLGTDEILNQGKAYE